MLKSLLLLAVALVAGLVARSAPAQQPAPAQQSPPPFGAAQPLRFPDDIEAGAAPIAAPAARPRAISRPSADGDPSAGGSEAQRSPPSLWGTLGPLAIVVVLIVVIARLWKKHSPLAVPPLPSEAIEILGRRPIDPRQSILLVRLGSQILLLGSSATGLQTLAAVSDPVEVEALAGLCRPTGTGTTPAGMVRSWFARGTTPAARRVRTPGEQRFAERLRQMSDQRPDDDSEGAHAA